MSVSKIPERVTRDQHKASDPQTSAWVAANAGSGKTHVLAQRVIRLLLDGVDPAKILCITFTKAAAANMATRVFETLAKWTALDDAALDDAIAATGSHRPDAKERARARRLFACALETPGGLKVQTIHAFCTRLLHQFPFEANVAARFTVLDDTAQMQLLEAATTGVLLEAAGTPDGPLGRALEFAIATGADVTFRSVIAEAVGMREEIGRWIDAAGGVEPAIDELARELGVDPAETLETLTNRFFAEAVIPMRDWPVVMQALEAGSKTDLAHVPRYTAALDPAHPERLDQYLAIFCTATLEPRKNIVTKAIQTADPELFANLVREQHRVCQLLARRRAVEARDRSAALLRLASAVMVRYRGEKERRGLLDYEDLIERTIAMFDRVSATWVLYKLDLGIDHILIDEAQDTSPRQWDIIGRLVAEFAAGAGARTIKRTVFAVGDDKQSIFSFQGAVPHHFGEMQRQWQSLFQGAGLPWQPVKLNTSFRSGEAVLAGVDAVFSRVEAYTGLSSDAAKPVHESLPDKAPGEVEIWDTEKPGEGRDIEGWDAPFDTHSESSPPVKLAQRIAAEIKTWIANGGRPGEALVLVRKRGLLFEAVIRALKHAQIDVAGADRLVLTEHIAVMDLLVLADALLLPQDDLALATLLRSPLFGLTDDELYALAHARPGTLRAALAARTDAPFAAAWRRLMGFEASARHASPFAFYAGVLGAGGGRRQFFARLGPEANDAIDEFLNLALDYESRETPSLQGFVAWLRSAQTEVKRDMEMNRDEVRVMTVHGAKGLESRLVILADTTSPSAGTHPPRLLALPAAHAPPGTPDRIVWAKGRKDDSAAMEAARDAALAAEQHEHRRLLYVAMTRAAERLIVCGYEGMRARAADCWYDLVFDALAPLSVCEERPHGKAWTFRKGDAAKPTTRDNALPAPVTGDGPAWLTQPAATAPAGPRLIAPSHAYDGGDDAPRAAGGAPAHDALQRGSLFHRLMQSLPDVAPGNRAALAAQFLARNAADVSLPERDAMVAQVIAILDDPRFAALFAPGSRAEVPIVGRLHDSRGGIIAVSGQIDRLCVTPEAVLVADYKTNRPPPRRIAEVSQGIVTQLALYRAVLAKLYPGRPIRMALVWTEVPDLMDVPGDRLDRALATVTGM